MNTYVFAAACEIIIFSIFVARLNELSRQTRKLQLAKFHFVLVVVTRAHGQTEPGGGIHAITILNVMYHPVEAPKLVVLVSAGGL